MERGESIRTTKVIVVSLSCLFIGLIVGAWMNKQPSKPTKRYPVRVILIDNSIQSTFDCDSATLTHAWKDGVKIDIQNVFQIKFN
jgi:hypothetical protein